MFAYYTVHVCNFSLIVQIRITNSILLDCTTAVGCGDAVMAVDKLGPNLHR